MVFSRTVLLCEGDSERLALPVFARALGIDLGALCISIIPVGGNGYGPALMAICKAAFGIPWVVLSDSEPATLAGLAGDLVDAGYTTKVLVDAARAAGRLPQDILEPTDCFSYSTATDFETAMLAAGAAPEFQSALDRLLGANALSRFVAEHSKKDAGFSSATLAIQIAEMVKHGPARRLKPLLALTVAEDITKAGKDPSRIPPEIKRSLETAAAFSEGRRVKS